LFSDEPDLSDTPAGPDREALTSSQVEAAPTETPQRGSVGLHRRYYALLRRSRLLAVAFWAAMAYFLFWAVPWLPGGLSKEDYTEQVTLTLILGGVCVLLGLGTLVLREYLRRTREALLAWGTVYDDTTGLYNRRYFYDRLSLECEWARRHGTTFSLIVIRLQHEGEGARGPSAGALRRLAAALSQATRPSDLVAVLGGNELAVVAMGASRKMVPQVVERLKKALGGSITDSGEHLSLCLGAATYSTRVRHPSELLRSARSSLHGAPSPDAVGEKEGKAA
jgi:diguanylate cyclase (GGDEF)-like protein